MQDLIVHGDMVAIAQHMAQDPEVLGVLQELQDEGCSELEQLLREALADLQAWEPDVSDVHGDPLNLLLISSIPFAIKAGVTVYLLTEQRINDQPCVVEARRVGGAVSGAFEPVARNAVFLMLGSSRDRRQGNQHARMFIPQQDVYLMPTYAQPGQFIVLKSEHGSRLHSKCGRFLGCLIAGMMITSLLMHRALGTLLFYVWLMCLLCLMVCRSQPAGGARGFFHPVQVKAAPPRRRREKLHEGPCVLRRRGLAPQACRRQGGHGTSLVSGR